MRRQARRGNGRFTRNTLENTVGLTANVHERKANGEWCGAINPSRVGEPRPTVCSHCGESLIQDQLADACAAVMDPTPVDDDTAAENFKRVRDLAAAALRR